MSKVKHFFFFSLFGLISFSSVHSYRRFLPAIRLLPPHDAAVHHVEIHPDTIVSPLVTLVVCLPLNTLQSKTGSRLQLFLRAASFSVAPAAFFLLMTVVLTSGPHAAQRDGRVELIARLPVREVLGRDTVTPSDVLLQRINARMYRTICRVTSMLQLFLKKGRPCVTDGNVCRVVVQTCSLNGLCNCLRHPPTAQWPVPMTICLAAPQGEH